MDTSQLFRFLFDACMLVWFFLPLKTGEKRRWKSAGFLVLLLLLPIYLYAGSGSLASIFLRFTVRVFAYSLWVFWYKGLDFSRSLYLGILCWLTFSSENNIFLTPQLSVLRRLGQSGEGVGILGIQGGMIGNAAEMLLEAGLITLVSRLVPMNSILRIRNSRWIVAFALIGCALYVKTTLKLLLMVPTGTYPAELTSYPILMQLLGIAALILFERYLYNRKIREEIRLNEVINHYRYENAAAHLKAEEDVKRIHHDMKNHLIVLQNLMDQNENASSYVQKLMDEISDYGNLAETGNPLLNGLISEKMYQAARFQIDLNACFDFTAGSFVDPLDVCAIFGNALDNAIEASKQVKDAERRSILVKCGLRSGNLVITFKNYFEGGLKVQNALPISTKTGHLHGIGLNSIRRSVEKYGGSMTTECDAYHNFILTVVLPIPEKKNEEP